MAIVVSYTEAPLVRAESSGHLSFVDEHLPYQTRLVLGVR